MRGKEKKEARKSPRTGLCSLSKHNDYLKATIEVVKFVSSDVITTSDDGKDDGEKDFFD